MKLTGLSLNRGHRADLDAFSAAVARFMDQCNRSQALELVLNHMGRTFSHTEPALPALLRDDPGQKPVHFDGIEGAGLLAEAASDTSHRTFLLDHGALVVGTAADRDLLVDRKELDDMLRTGGHTVAAARTLILVDDRKTVRAHGDGVKGAGPLAGPESKAAVTAGLASAGNHRSGPAVGDAVIPGLFHSRLAPAHTEDPGHDRVPGSGFHTEDLGDSLDGIAPSDRAPGDRRRSLGHGLGHGAASGKSAPAAVCAGEELEDSLHLGVHLHGELFGSKDETKTRRHP